MARLFQKIDLDNINVHDIIFVDVEIKVGYNVVNNVMLLATIMHFIRNKQRVEVQFLAADNTTMWFDAARCYYTTTKSIER